jgi:nicotinate-nucleotide--dimethylbenzimidazole phosphoribosyltransferase
MAKVAGAEVFPIDVGMFTEVDGIRSLKPAKGGQDMAKGPVLSEEEAIKAVEAGILAASDLKSQGFGLAAIGEIGIGNTAAASAVACALLNLPPRLATGRGAGLDDLALEKKIMAIETALALNKPDPENPLDVIAKVGSLDIAAMAGAYLGLASQGIPAVADGFPSLAAALCAARLCRNALGFILPSHSGAEPGIRFILDELGFAPIIDAKMRLGEGTGAVALFPLLDMAMAVKSFSARRSEL